ncbi:hypothetical protein ACFL0F_00690 [Patescibacteria group bacterium]
MIKKILIILLIIIFVFGLIVLYFVITKPSPDSGVIVPSSNEKLIGGDKDDNGCLVAAGYSWCEEKQKCLRVWEEGCDQITTLLTNIKDDTGVDFTKLQEISFDWYMGDTPDSAISISGYSVEAYNVSSIEFESLKAYFADNSYELDVFNNSTATLVGIAGYREGNTVCLLIATEAGRINEGDGLIAPEEGKNDVQIKCGEII